MWIKLTNANFSANNIGTLKSYKVDTTGLVGLTVNPKYVSYKTDGETINQVFTFTVSSGYKFASGSTIKIGSDIKYTAGSDLAAGSTFTITMDVSGNIAFVGVAEKVAEPDTPVDPGTTNYTFTINPTPTSATVTLSATGYSTVSGTGSKSITVANGTKVSWSVSASGYTTRTGDWTISGGNKTENIVLTASGGGETSEGEWLSVLLTGDADAHNKFMNGNLTGAGSLSSGHDVIYAAPQVQSVLEGKKIYKIASNGLNENTLTLYSNPWKGDNSSNTTDGRTAVGTVTSTSAQAAGTIVEYSVSNPSAIKDNETLSIGWTGPASGIKTVKNYNTSVYYLNPKSGTTFTSKLASFCSFDFYVGE